MVAERIVDLVASADASTGSIEDRDAEPIKGIHPEFLRVEMEIEVPRWDGVKPVACVREAQRVEAGFVPCFGMGVEEESPGKGIDRMT